MIEVKNISKAFGGKHVLYNCSLKIKTGKITTLIGPNGCGKTTLFNIISGLLNQDEGYITINKKTYKKINCEKLISYGIARTFQDPPLFKNLTVKEHLILALIKEQSFFKNLVGKVCLSEKDEKKIEKILKDLNINHKKDFRAMDLSGGQRKLVDIAMVLAKDFDVILLDEPTAGVAPELRELFKKLLLKLKEKGKTVFLIEHDMNFVMGLSDEIIVLNEGKVMVKGKPEDIRKNKKVLEAYLGV